MIARYVVAMIVVYRVQDKSGRGPFQPGFSRKWADIDFAPGMAALPTWMEEFGDDLINRHGRSGEYFGSAVRTIDEISRWFSEKEKTRLQKLGFRVVSMRVNRILAESKNQVVFARDVQLRRRIVIHPWP